MGKLVLFITATLLAPVIAFGGQSVKDSQALAVGQFPALAERDSPINRRFVELFTAARAADATFDSDAYWPLRLARQAAAELQTGWPTSSIEQIQLEEDKRLAALRSEGLSKKRDESLIRLGSLFQQRKLLEGKDSVAQQRIDVRIAQINQEMDKLEVAAAFQRWRNAMDLRIGGLKREQSLAIAEGHMGDAFTLRDEITELSDQLAESLSLGEIWYPPPK
jgi:hypothetical protein